MQKKPFTHEQILKLRETLKGRDLVLFSLGFDSMLRRSDLLSLRVKDVIDHCGNPKTRITRIMRKSGSSVTFSVGETARKLLCPYIVSKALTSEDYLFPGKYKGKPLSGIQYSRLVKRWAMLLRLDHNEFSTHSMRRTKSAIVYGKTRDIEVCRQILGHKSVANTSLYLNVSQENALSVVDSLNL